MKKNMGLMKTRPNIYLTIRLLILMMNQSETEEEITELDSRSESDAEVIPVIPNKRKTEWRKNNGKRWKKPTRSITII